MSAFDWPSRGLLQHAGARRGESGWLPGRVSRGELNPTEGVPFITPYEIHFHRATRLSTPLSLTLLDWPVASPSVPTEATPDRRDLKVFPNISPV